MSFVLTKKLPTPMENQRIISCFRRTGCFKSRERPELIIYTGASDKFMVMIGPCSADNEEGLLITSAVLPKVQEKVKDKLVLVPRIYTNKPRTTGEGYKGAGPSAGSGSRHQIFWKV